MVSNGMCLEKNKSEKSVYGFQTIKNKIKMSEIIKQSGKDKGKN